MATMTMNGITYLSKSEIKRRGFTDAGIRDRLGLPDHYAPQADRPWAAPMQMYDETRVNDAIRTAIRQPVTTA